MTRERQVLESHIVTARGGRNMKFGTQTRPPSQLWAAKTVRMCLILSCSRLTSLDILIDLLEYCYVQSFAVSSQLPGPEGAPAFLSRLFGLLWLPLGLQRKHPRGELPHYVIGGALHVQDARPKTLSACRKVSCSNCRQNHVSSGHCYRIHFGVDFLCGNADKSAMDRGPAGG